MQKVAGKTHTLDLFTLNGEQKWGMLNMRGFHRVNGINWLNDSGTVTVETLGTNNIMRTITVPGELPAHWEKVKKILLK